MAKKKQDEPAETTAKPKVKVITLADAARAFHDKDLAKMDAYIAIAKDETPKGIRSMRDELAAELAKA